MAVVNASISMKASTRFPQEAVGQHQCCDSFPILGIHASAPLFSEIPDDISVTALSGLHKCGAPNSAPCASRGNMAVVRCLAEQDANVNDTDERGRTALMKGAAAGRDDVVQYLAEERGADIEAKNYAGVTALMMASMSGYVPVVRHLCEQGADVNAKDELGYTALMYAAKSNRIEVVRYLTGCGTDVNIKRKDELTALLVAAEWRSLDVIRYLVAEVGADVEATNGDGHTVLTTMTSFFGRTTLMHAAEAGNIQLVQLLVEHGTNVNTHGEDGLTALMCAAGEDIVRFLVEERGADVDIQDKAGKTALVHAVEGKHIGIVRCLVQEYGADANVRGQSRSYCSSNCCRSRLL